MVVKKTKKILRKGKTTYKTKTTMIKHINRSRTHYKTKKLAGGAFESVKVPHDHHELSKKELKTIKKKQQYKNSNKTRAEFLLEIHINKKPKMQQAVSTIKQQNPNNEYEIYKKIKQHLKSSLKNERKINIKTLALALTFGQTQKENKGPNTKSKFPKPNFRGLPELEEGHYSYIPSTIANFTSTSTNSKKNNPKARAEELKRMRAINIKLRNRRNISPNNKRLLELLKKKEKSPPDEVQNLIDATRNKAKNQTLSQTKNSTQTTLNLFPTNEPNTPTQLLDTPNNLVYNPYGFIPKKLIVNSNGNRIVNSKAQQYPLESSPNSINRKARLNKNDRHTYVNLEELKKEEQDIKTRPRYDLATPGNQPTNSSLHEYDTAAVGVGVKVEENPYATALQVNSGFFNVDNTNHVEESNKKQYQRFNELKPIPYLTYQSTTSDGYQIPTPLSNTFSTKSAVYLEPTPLLPETNSRGYLIPTTSISNGYEIPTTNLKYKPGSTNNTSVYQDLTYGFDTSKTGYTTASNTNNNGIYSQGFGTYPN